MTAGADEHHVIEVRIDSDPKYLCVVRAVVDVIAHKVGLDDATCGQVSLAVDEAVTNVMRHGYDGATDQPIWVKVRMGDAAGNPGFTIAVEDRGRQVDPTAIRGRDLDDVRPGGLGVHIIRQVMDQVTYTQRDEGGMRLVMSKTTASTDSPSTAKPGASQS